MKTDEFQTGRTNAYLNSRAPYADFTIEMVTETLLMVNIVLPINDERVDGATWMLAHLIDAVALRVEQETGNPFRAFVLLFTAAWSMISARQTSKRKESAADLTLPPFLGGSHDPTQE